MEEGQGPGSVRANSILALGSLCSVLGHVVVSQTGLARGAWPHGDGMGGVTWYPWQRSVAAGE